MAKNKRKNEDVKPIEEGNGELQRNFEEQEVEDDG